VVKPHPFSYPKKRLRKEGGRINHNVILLKKTKRGGGNSRPPKLRVGGGGLGGSRRTLGKISVLGEVGPRGDDIKVRKREVVK